MPFYQASSEGNLLPQVVKVGSVRMATAERADIIGGTGSNRRPRSHRQTLHMPFEVHRGLTRDGRPIPHIPSTLPSRSRRPRSVRSVPERPPARPPHGMVLLDGRFVEHRRRQSRAAGGRAGVVMRGNLPPRSIRCEHRCDPLRPDQGLPEFGERGGVPRCLGQVDRS